MSSERPPLTARWFHVGRPWTDSPGLIYADSEDPHIGTFVVSVDDWPDKDAAAIADRIVADHNSALALPGEALRTALEHVTKARDWLHDGERSYAEDELAIVDRVLRAAASPTTETTPMSEPRIPIDSGHEPATITEQGLAANRIDSSAPVVRARPSGSGRCDWRA